LTINNFCAQLVERIVQLVKSCPCVSVLHRVAQIITTTLRNLKSCIGNTDTDIRTLDSSLHRYFPTKNSPSTRKFSQNPADILPWNFLLDIPGPKHFLHEKHSPKCRLSITAHEWHFCYKLYSSMSLLLHSPLCRDGVSMQLLKMIDVINMLATSIYT